MKKHTFYLILLLSFVFNSSIIWSQEILQSSEYGELILNYLDDNKDGHDFVDKDLETLIITNSFKSESTGINHVYVNQTYEGVKIYNAISSFAVKDNAVFYFANRFLSTIENRINTTIPVTSPETSITKVINELQLGSTQNLEQIEHNNNTYVFSNSEISNQKMTSELVFFNTNEGLRLVWDVMLYAIDNSHWYSVRVDAVNNTILDTNDLILNCKFGDNHNSEHHKSMDLFNSKTSNASALVDGSTYNVFKLPAESPNHGSRQIVTNPASPLASRYGWHDDNGVTGADYTITRGNNVWAQEDRDGNNGTGYSPDGGGTLNFDFPLDINQPPAGYQDVAITNLFYTNNMMHDIWYHHGFDEASGNFQATNYSGFGLGNDFVLADAQDGSGVNNATFGTPQEGQNPGMTMFLWTPSGSLNAPLTINNGSLAGNYDGSEAQFGSGLSTTPITADLILVTDGTTPDINDACQSLTNGVQISGNIAVIRRGNCEFGAKVLRAENEGAIAAIVVNNEPGGTIAMGAGAIGGLVTIPSIMVNQADGEAIIAALTNGESLNATLVNNGPFSIDGDFDNGIVAHEYGHGISNRLTGGASNVNCLFNDEQMGEGWSDWFGLMITLEAGDLSTDVRGIGTFAVSQPTTGNGIRPAPYTTDLTINNFTYGATNNTGLSQPHGIGFVWSTMLWDLTWAYIDKYGFDSDLYNGTGGNNKVMQLVIDGLKLQACNPGFVDGRDALLAADIATTGGENQCMIWEIFAARGLGFNASQGSSNSRTDQTEDFSMPPSDDPSLANCSLLSVNDETIEQTIKIYPNPIENQLSIETKKYYEDALITLTDLNGRIVLREVRTLSNTILISTAQLQSGLYILNIKGDNFTYNEKIIKN